MIVLRCLALALVSLNLLLAGCSSTQIAASWKDPEFRGRVEKVYLVGLAEQEINRRMFEDAFRQELLALGVTGFSSYQDLPETASVDQQGIRDQMKRRGADSLLMARVVDRHTEQLVNPGYASSYYAPTAYYRDWGSYYNRRYDSIYQPATVTEIQIVTIEANLYEAASGKLIWSAQLETAIESDMEKLFNDFVKTVTKDLREKNLL